jgi:hypothetical protein
MPQLRAVPVMLSAGERTTGKKRVRGAKTAWRDRLRAQIVLAAARGHPRDCRGWVRGRRMSCVTALAARVASLPGRTSPGRFEVGYPARSR